MNVNQLLISLVMCGLMTACSPASEQQDEAQDPTKTESTITSEANLEANKKVLLEDETIKEYFDTLEKTIDEYVVMLLKMNEEIAKSEKRGDTEENPMQLLSGITSIAIESGGKLANLTDKVDELKEKAEALKEDLDEERKVAFVALYAKIILRLSEAAAKEEAISEEEE